MEATGEVVRSAHHYKQNGHLYHVEYVAYRNERGKYVTEKIAGTGGVCACPERNFWLDTLRDPT